MSNDGFKIMSFMVLFIYYGFIGTYYPMKAYSEAKKAGYKGSYPLFFHTEHCSSSLEDFKKHFFFLRSVPKKARQVFWVLLGFCLLVCIVTSEKF